MTLRAQRLLEKLTPFQRVAYGWKHNGDDLGAPTIGLEGCWTGRWDMVSVEMGNNTLFCKGKSGPEGNPAPRIIAPSS